ncbi:MAG: hypothetical protein KAS62_09220, partial [Candidatus Delongbacteria bacterium]|nr:hypothetical protein [Candidatus Delongbacteria bacterium]
MYADFVKQFWEIPLWDRFISGGIPFVDATHGDTFYPAAFLKFFIPLYKALGLKLVLHVFLSGVFMFILLKNYGLKKYSSIIGSIAYMTAPMIVTLVYPGHDAKMYVAALLPLAFNFLLKAMNGQSKFNFTFFGMTIGIMILSSHVQTTYFALWFLFFFLIYRMILSFLTKEKNIKEVSGQFGLFWSAIIIALFMGAVQLIPPYIYAKEFSIRGTEEKTSFEHACSWGMHPEEAFSLIVPEFCGENRLSHYGEITTQAQYEIYKKDSETGANSYWGRNAFKLNSEFSGVIILIMTILALIFYRGKHRKDVIFFASFGVFTVLYSLVNHTPLFWLAYKIVPGVKLFRGQGMILFILSFVLAMVTAIFIDHIFEEKEDDNVSDKFIKKLPFIAGGLVLLAFISAIALPGLLSLFKAIFDPVKLPDTHYIGVIRTGIIISFILVAAFLIVIYLFKKNKISILTITIILSILVFVDSYRVNRKFIKTVDIDKLGIKFKSNQVIDQIKELEKKEGYFRILDLDYFGYNQLPIHGISTIRGFHDNELKWYRKYRGVNSAGVNTDRNLLEGLNTGQKNLLDLAGARFIFYKDRDNKKEIIPNPDFMPRAFVVSNFEIIEDEDKIVERLKSPEFDLKNTVILEEKPDYTSGNSVDVGKIENYEYLGNEIELKVNMKEKGIVVITDNYFPYWHAYDKAGVEIPIYKANLTFRAIVLDKGEHEITFKYISKP